MMAGAGSLIPVRTPRAHRRGGLRFALAGGLALLAGCTGLPHAERTTDEPSSIQLQTLRQPINPPEILARTREEARTQAARLAPGGVRADLLEKLRDHPRTERVAAAQSPFFFESAIGRAYLAAGASGASGRAIAQGWPAEQCPAFGVALPESDRGSAALKALERCIDTLPPTAGETCACRLLALDDVLLADAPSFVYARGVSTLVYHPASGRSATLVAEERHPRDLAAEILQTLEPETLDALSKGARRMWLLSPASPAAAFDLAANGEAALVFVEGSRESLTPARRLTGQWRSDGFRRGRLAGVARVADDAGDSFVVVFGYPPSEIEARRKELIAEARRLGG